MILFLADENFNNNILRGIKRGNPNIDIIRIQDTEIAGADDPTVLKWAAQENRILLTHDMATITRYAYDRVKSGLSMPGVFEVNNFASIGKVVEDILMLAELTIENEWEGQILFLPL